MSTAPAKASLVMSASALALAAVAAIGALTRDEPTPARDAPAREDDGVGDARDPGAIEDRVAALEREVARLRLARGPMGGAAPIVDEGVATAPTGSEAAPASDAPTPEVLAALVQQELQKESERRSAQRRAAWDEHATERLKALAEDAKLSPDQEEKLEAMLSAEREEISALFQKARDEGGFFGVRGQVREIRAKTDENARAILDDGQYEKYEALRDEERAMFRGGRDREEREREGRRREGRGRE